MQFKSTTAIVVILFVVASLLVSGCVNNTTSNISTTNQTPSTSAATHDVFLENYLAAFKNGTYSDTRISIKAWELTWINSTSAQLQLATVNKSTNVTYSSNQTFMVFSTAQDATNYLNSANMTAYSLASTVYPAEGAYRMATGHAPQIYKQYQWNEGNPFNISEYKFHQIEQLDNVVRIATAKSLG
jgi:predicted small secreted protein